MYSETYNDDRSSVETDLNVKTISTQKQEEKPKKHKTGFWNVILVYLQRLGKSLMYPIAVLPMAALLNRFGVLFQTSTSDSFPDGSSVIHDGGFNHFLWWFGFVIGTTGGVIFANLAIIFAMGLGFGMAKDNRGEAALVGAVFYLILVGLLSEGGLASLMYNNVLQYKEDTITVYYINNLVSYEGDLTSYGPASYVDGEFTGFVANLTYEGGYSQLLYLQTVSYVYIEPGTSYSVVDPFNPSAGPQVYIAGEGGAYIPTTSYQYQLDIGVFGGIVAGCLTGALYNKYSQIKLPESLAFFGGRRFVPMVAMLVAIPVAFIFAILWPWIQYLLILFGNAFVKEVTVPIYDLAGDKANVQMIVMNNAFTIPGTFLYGFVNRLLQPFGLHHVINTFLWFQLPITGYRVEPWSGDLVGGIPIQTTIYGDINAFTYGINTSGVFTSGYFPLFLGGLPGTGLAMIMAAKQENRKQVATFLIGVMFVAFLTGIDEPLAFSFIFVSPMLWIIHCFYTGFFCMIVIAMHIHIGFGFSAGLIDYLISFPQSWGMANYETGVYHITSNPLWIIPLSGIMFAVYYFTFYPLIIKFDIKTPGREDEAITGDIKSPFDLKEPQSKRKDKKRGIDKYELMADMLIEAIHRDNFKIVDSCATRLRLIVKDNKNIDEQKIKLAGSYGIKRLGTEGLQIIIGTDVQSVVDVLKDKLRDELKNEKK